MLQPPPARPGMREDEIDTPALLIDLDAFEANLDHMAELLAPTGAKLRAHAKTHKSPVIAKLQMARGAVGQCVQKVAEAEALAWGGIPDILVSNEVVGASKLARLAALARIAKVAVCADDAAQVAAIETAAADAGVRLPVLVEIDVGAGRCGVAPGPDAVDAGEAHRRFEAPDLRRPAGVPRQRAAQAHGGGTPHADRQRGGCIAPDGGAVAPAGAGLPDRRRCRHRHVPDRVCVRRLQRDPGRQLRVHGRRLCAQPGRGWRADRHVPAFAVRAGNRDERAEQEHRGGGCRAQGGGGGQRHADDLAAAGHPLCQRLGRARQAGGGIGERPHRSSARSCGWCPGTAIRRWIGTTGMSACATGGWSACGRLRRGAGCTEQAAETYPAATTGRGAVADNP